MGLDVSNNFGCRVVDMSMNGKQVSECETSDLVFLLTLIRLLQLIADLKKNPGRAVLKEEKGIILAPINVKNMHWALAYLDESTEIVYIDGMSGEVNAQAKHFIYYVLSPYCPILIPNLIL